MKFSFLLLLVAAIFFLCGALFLWRVYFSKSIIQMPRASAAIGEHRYEVEIASTLTQKAKGLAGRASLGPGTGMLFTFASSSRHAFTMHGMRFPLDMVWIAEGKIVDISKNLQPDTGILASLYRPSVPADMVLELNAGVADADGLKAGDKIVISYK